MSPKRLFSAAVCASLLLTAPGASAAVCVNRFLSRTDGPKKIVTLLTGKLTFQEAQALVTALHKKEAEPIEWVDDKGKTLAKGLGSETRAIRPMPVGCDGKTSGVVMTVSFLSGVAPSKKMFIKFDANTTVEFEQQSE